MTLSPKKTEGWKLKKWYSVYAPKVFNDALVGEMPANDDKYVVGRNIVVGLDSAYKKPIKCLCRVYT